jgi:ribosomal protein L29
MSSYMNYTDIQKKSVAELGALVTTTREELRAERFKDRFTKKASIIRKAKLVIARALTEMNTRDLNGDTK